MSTELQSIDPPRTTKQRLARQALSNLSRVRCELRNAALQTQQSDHLWLKHQLLLVDDQIEVIAKEFKLRTGIGV